MNDVDLHSRPQSFAELVVKCDEVATIVDCVRGRAAKKSYKYSLCGSLEHLIFLSFKRGSIHFDDIGEYLTFCGDAFKFIS